jgi:hypothetical protein
MQIYPKTSFFLLFLCALLIPSCGFIIGSFGDENENGEPDGVYTLRMRYNYSGYATVDHTSPLIFLFIPLNENNELEEDSFLQAQPAVAFIPSGIVTLDLEEGPYTVLGYIDSNNNSDLDMGEVYAFFYMKDLVSTFRNPDYIWVYSHIDEDAPCFEMGSGYTMQGFYVLFPENNETLYGKAVDDEIHFIYIAGLSMTDNIDYVAMYINGAPAVPPSMQVQGQEAWVIPINMYGYPSSSFTPYELRVEAYSSSGLEAMQIVPFYYEAPQP